MSRFVPAQDRVAIDTSPFSFPPAETSRGGYVRAGQYRESLAPWQLRPPSSEPSAGSGADDPSFSIVGETRSTEWLALTP